MLGDRQDVGRRKLVSVIQGPAVGRLTVAIWTALLQFVVVCCQLSNRPSVDDLVVAFCSYGACSTLFEQLKSQGTSCGHSPASVASRPTSSSS